MASYDYLIAGQGLAGSLLSYFLIREGKKVLVADPGGTNASMIAPGMFNPLTGRRMSKSWRVDEALPFAFKTYRQMENDWHDSFLHPLPMLRFFANENERDATRRKIAEEHAEDYVSDYFDSLIITGFCETLPVGCRLTQTGYVNTHHLLHGCRRFLAAQYALKEIKVEYKNVELTEEGVRWDGNSFHKIIFCEGYRGAQNPWFQSLPWNLAKGEVLTIHAPELDLKDIYNRHLYIIPLGNAYFRVGATYEWADLTESITEAGRLQLTGQLDKLLCVPYTITDHHAGVRPTVINRRPFAGLHPKYQQIGIFNGLGTKGVMLSPLLAWQLTRHLLYGGPLFAEVDASQRMLKLNTQQ